MGAESMFRKVFGTKGLRENFASHGGDGYGLHPAITAELQRLDLFQRGLADRAMRYVATGNGHDVLDQISLISRGPYDGRKTYQSAEPRIVDVTARTSVALATGEIGPGPVVLRLIECRHAADLLLLPYRHQLQPREIVIRGLIGMLFSGLYKHKVNYKVDWTKVISLEAALAHFEAVGGTFSDVFALLLQSDESAYPENYPDSWSASDTCRTLLCSQPAALAAAMQAAEQRHRFRGLKLMEHHRVADVPENEGLIVALLTKPFAKEDRATAIAALARLDPAHLLGVLERHLPKGDADTRHALVEAAGRATTPDVAALLAERAKVEKTARVQAAIAAVLEIEASAAAADDAGSADGSYLAINGERVHLPARHDLGSDTIPAPGADLRRGFAEVVAMIEDQRRQWTEQENLRRIQYKRDVCPPPTPYTQDEIAAAYATLTEAAPRPTLPSGAQKTHPASVLVEAVRGHPAGQRWLRAVLAPLSVRAGLRLLMATQHGDVPCLIGQGHAYRPSHLFGVDVLRAWLADGRFDLRDVAGVENLRSILGAARSRRSHSHGIDAIEALPADAVWPWLAESMEVFDEALGLRPATVTIPLPSAMAALALLPQTPQRYLPRLAEIAVTEKRPLRLQAMALLRGASDLAQRIEALLDDKRQQVRINAAGWLADIRATSSEPALRKRLKKESSDPVRAALIIALQRLGADLTDVIGPASLIAQAERAIAKAPLKLPEWLVKSGLPAVRFRDGATVPQAVVEYWLALAIRLKDPGAHGQFGIYLDQLVPEDARRFSNWVLESWITFDTAGPTRDEAVAYARSVYLGKHVPMNGRYVRGAQLPPEEQERLIARLVREKMGELVNSGTDTKGLLALACRADPVWAAGRVRWFLKTHGRRSNQAMALLEALAGTGAPAALQVVIAASTRLKQKSTQARAAEIAQRYADDRGWSVDELADRTVPSAGFDDDGTLDLPCGEDAKPYVARLDAALAIHLFNPEGKPIKALPAGDDDNTKESKKAFTAARKELTQIVTLQGERLFEAMCVERRWPVADWRLAFHQHPVMRRLIERLVWQGLDAAGQPLGLFRPTQEGDFTDSADNDVSIDEFAAIRLAHGALVDADTCKVWVAHLKDYEVKPFLVQFDTLRSPLTPELAEAEAVIDRQGWVADSLTFRGASEKRGYQRVMRDSGGCHEYVKEFPSHGITATIWHTGSYAVDDNNRVALKELKITKSGHRGPYRLKDVPPVMLAECWADYHAVAAKGAFDPAWETISPW